MLGEAASATLGYIWKNLPGAYRSHQMYKRTAPRPRSTKVAAYKRIQSAARSKKYAARRSYGRKRKSIRSYRGSRKYAKKTASNDHSGFGSQSRMVARSGRVKPWPKSFEGSMNYAQQNTLAVTCVTGTQTMFSVALDLTVEQFIASGGLSANTPANQYHRGLMSFNPNLRASGDYSGGVTPAGTRRAGSKIYVGSINYEFLVSNESTTPATLELYALTPRTSGLSASWGGTNAILTEGCIGQLSGIIDQEMLGYGDAIQAGYAGPVPTNATPGKPTTSTYGFNPWTIKGFRAAFKMLSKKQIDLAPGAAQKIKINLPVGKYFDESYVTSMGQQTNGAIPYHTIQIMGILKGSPVIIKPGADGTSPIDFTTTDGAVTTSQVEVALAFTRKISVAFVKNGASQFHITANNFRSLSGGAIGKQIDADDDNITASIVT
ncbi:Cap [Lactuca sativa geminiviridae]|nr:Cap [Lactuca sativa geminiviridae]